MKLFLVLSNAPNASGEAIEVVAYEVVEHTSRLGHSIVVQVILREPRSSAQAVHTDRMLEQLNLPRVEKCPVLYLDEVVPVSRGRGPLARAFRLLTSFRTARLFPATRLGPVVESRAMKSGADAILSVWSWEALAATYRISGIPKFVYYGNPDHLPPAARFNHPTLFDIPVSSLANRFMLGLERAWNRRRKVLNLRMMNACEVVTNNSILDAEYYASHGHRRSIYLQNMWPPADAECPPSAVPGPPAAGPVKIIGSVGNLGATGNTFALAYLGTELMPRLAERFGARPFEVHLLGRGRPSAFVSTALTDPRLVFRGWVGDINEEIRSAAVFLVLTNVNDDFLVGNTRILLAWALRGCVIMHANSARAMPEICHGDNVLAGRTPGEIADCIFRIVDDPALRSRIADGGHRTFQAHYRSDVVVPKMLSLVEDMVHEFKEDNRKHHRRGLGDGHAAVNLSGLR